MDHPYVQFTCKHIDFIECLAYINRDTDMKLYRFIEKLVYEEIPKDKITSFKSLLKNVGVEKFVNTVKNTIPVSPEKNVKYKRKNIKENMLENYVIRNKRDKKFLQELNLKIFLKMIPTKNITVDDGNIVDIKIP